MEKGKMGKKEREKKGKKVDHTRNGMAVGHGHNCSPTMAGAIYQMAKYGGLLCQPSAIGYSCSFCGIEPGSLRIPAVPLPQE